MKGRREKMWLLSSCLSQCETLHVNPFTLFQNDQKSHLIQCERCILFENHQKCLTCILQLWHFWPVKIYLSGNTVWQQASYFQKLAKLIIYGIFNELLASLYVARFARNFEWDFFFNFQTLCWASGKKLRRRLGTRSHLIADLSTIRQSTSKISCCLSITFTYPLADLVNNSRVHCSNADTNLTENWPINQRIIKLLRQRSSAFEDSNVKIVTGTSVGDTLLFRESN